MTLALPVVFDAEAEEDLAAFVDYLAPRNRAAMLDTLAELEGTLGLAAMGTLEGAEVTLRSGAAVRRLVVRSFLVYYQRRPGELRVLRVYDGRRRPLER